MRRYAAFPKTRLALEDHVGAALLALHQVVPRDGVDLEDGALVGGGAPVEDGALVGGGALLGGDALVELHHALIVLWTSARTFHAPGT